MRHSLIAIAGVMSLAASADAQSGLRVRVEAESRPLSGALVALVDSSNMIVVEQLSSADGRATLDAAPGLYRVRVRRIGYRPFYSNPIRLPHTEPLLLQVESPRVVLQRMVVSARDECGRINPDAETLSAVWEEVSKALRSSQLTMTDLKRIARSTTYRRELNRDRAVLSSDSSNVPISSHRPFGAPDPASLVSLGYVRGNEFKGWDFYGPDERVLLSDGFTSTHCFRVTREKSRQGSIGISFRPSPRRRQSDIAGVIWLNEATSELKEIDFRFVNAGLLNRFEQGGFSRFRKMPSGAWIVSEWQLKMPRLVRSADNFNDAQPDGWIETGGKLYSSEELVIPKGTAHLTGSIYDSLALAPLRGARVTLGRRTTEADEAGRFAFADVPKGITTISFSHPAVSELGLIAFEQSIDIARDTTEISLATPSRRGAWIRICGAPPDSADEAERGILHGFVRDSKGQPVDSATVTIYFKQYKSMPNTTETVQPLELRVMTDAEGHYKACDFRRLTVGSVSAARLTSFTQKREFSFDKGLIVRQDLTFPSR